MKIKKYIASLLLAIVILGLPVAVLMNQMSGKFFSKEFTSQMLYEKVFNTNDLAYLMRAIANERIKDVQDLKTGMIIAIFSKADSRKWEDLLQTLLPQEQLKPVVDHTLDGFYDWQANEADYPDIMVHTAPFVEHLSANTEFLFRWAHSVTRPPQLKPDDLSRLRAQGFGDSIPPLLLSGVPDSIYDAFAKRGGELMAAQLDKANVPRVIDLTKIMKEKTEVQQFRDIKGKLNMLQGVSKWAWVVLALLLVASFWIYGFRNKTLPDFVSKSFFGLAVGMFAVAWLAGHYLLENLELRIHANGESAPRPLRNKVIDLITYYLDHATGLMHTIGWILIVMTIVIVAIKTLKGRKVKALQTKT
ncbi:hypothetical protein FGF1_29520 [Flavobacteriaceae bacterium GF1]